MSACCESAASPPVVAPRRAWYCPMCAGVESDEPGACPRCGMALVPSGVGAGGDDAEGRAMARRFRLAASLAVPVVVLAMGAHLPPLDRIPALTSAWLQFALTTLLLGWAGWPLFARGGRSFVSGRLNMFSLITLGVGAAYAFSVTALLRPAWFQAGGGHAGVTVYFEAAAVITTLVLLGQVLELRARAATGAAIRALLDLAPPIAHRVDADGDRDVALSEVAVGDRLRIKPGEKIPVDGVVTEGRSAVDESTLTGESVPVTKGPGDPLAAGTLNGNAGGMVMRATRVGADTLLARVVAMVAEAQHSRAPVQRLADAVAAWFVPAVVAIAGVTFAVWWFFGPSPAWAFALENAVAVLIIACPCALGLAAPMSIMVAVGRGAGAGVLVRDAAVLERLAEVDTLFVDKTGTLTAGHPQVVGSEVLGAEGLDDLLAVAAAAERGSEHPLASAIVRAAAERGLAPAAVEAFSAEAGGGVCAIVEGGEVRVGSRRWLEGWVSGAGWPESAAGAEAAGHSVVWVARPDRILGWLALADPIKPAAREVCHALAEMGVHVAMLTGDREPVARHVAAALDLRDVSAGLRPEEKLEVVQRARGAGHVVALAGDGVNDAPGLAAADVGIAMGSGTDVAMHSAAVTLVKGDLRGILRAIALSRATRRNIRQNLTFAFCYNALGIPLAAGVLYPAFGWLLSPMVASAAMALSSVSVVANALRLRRAVLDPIEFARGRNAD